MDINVIIDNALLVIIVLSACAASGFSAAMYTDKKIKQSEDKIWEYMKILNRTEPANTKSGMTRKLK